jgi:hypothetical protein
MGFMASPLNKEETTKPHQLLGFDFIKSGSINYELKY